MLKSTLKTVIELDVISDLKVKLQRTFTSLSDRILHQLWCRHVPRVLKVLTQFRMITQLLYRIPYQIRPQCRFEKVMKVKCRWKSRFLYRPYSKWRYPNNHNYCSVLRGSIPIRIIGLQLFVSPNGGKFISNACIVRLCINIEKNNFPLCFIISICIRVYKNRKNSFLFAFQTSKATCGKTWGSLKIWLTFGISVKN